MSEEMILEATGLRRDRRCSRFSTRAHTLCPAIWQNLRRRSATRSTKRSKRPGGLYIIGTERHESRRIDNQLRGRAGRQGDPGATRFYLSLEDDLMRLFGGERICDMMDSIGLDENTPIENKMLSNAIESAQKQGGGPQFCHPENGCWNTTM